MAKWEVRLLNVRLLRGGSRHLFRGGGVDLLTDSHTYTHLNWSKWVQFQTGSAGVEEANMH